MRHMKAGRTFNRDTNARRAMFRGLVINLVEREQIKTTLPKAKDLRSVVEKIITRARVDSVANRRLVSAELGNAGDATVKKLFTVLGPRYAKRPGGYTRVLKAGFRYGDAAPMAIIELVDRDESAKKGKSVGADNIRPQASDETPNVKKEKVVKPAAKAPMAKVATKTAAPKPATAKKEVAVKRRATGK